MSVTSQEHDPALKILILQPIENFNSIRQTRTKIDIEHGQVEGMNLATQFLNFSQRPQSFAAAGAQTKKGVVHNGTEIRIIIDE